MVANFLFILVFGQWVLGAPLSWSLLVGVGMTVVTPAYLRGLLALGSQFRRSAGRSDLTLDSVVRWDTKGNPGMEDADREQHARRQGGST